MLRAHLALGHFWVAFLLPFVVSVTAAAMPMVLGAGGSVVFEPDPTPPLDQFVAQSPAEAIVDPALMAPAPSPVSPASAPSIAIRAQSPSFGGGDLPSGETLAQVLRSIAYLHQGGGTAAVLAPDAKVPLPAGDADGGEWVGWRETILDSTLAGSALRSAIDVRATGDGPVGFTILGLGNFALEAASDGGAFDLTDVSSGWSVTLTAPRGDPNYVEYPRQAAPGDGSGLLTLHSIAKRIVDILTSPLGIILEMMAGLITAFWMIVRTVGLLRDVRSSFVRPGPYPRAYEPTPRRRRRRRRSRRRRRRSRTIVA